MFSCILDLTFSTDPVKKCVSTISYKIQTWTQLTNVQMLLYIDGSEFLNQINDYQGVKAYTKLLAHDRITGYLF